VVYKEYNQSVLPGLDAMALAAMVGLLTELGAAESRWLCERIAWPAALVEEHGRTAGFLMRAIPDRFLFEMRSLGATATGSRRPENFEYLLNDDVYVAGIGLSISERDRLLLLTDLASVLYRLHRVGIVVGDLSPKNLLFTMDPRPECFLVDCDAMRLRGASVLTQAETPDWAVPAGEEKATRASDVYKFGLLAVRLFARHQTSTDPAALSAVHPALGALARASLDPDPSRRPTPVLWAAQLGSALARVSTTATTTATAVPGPTRRVTAGSGAKRGQGARIGGLVGLLAAAAAAVLLAVAVAHSHQSQGAAGDATEGAGVATSQIYPTQGDQSTDTPTDTGAATQTTSSPPPTSDGLVQFGQGVQADPRAVAVGDMLNTYFNGINTGDYQSALSVEDPAGALNPGNASEVQKFEQGLQSTQDSQITLVSLGPGDTTSPATSAVVTFQSSQQAGYGPGDNPNQTCTNWSLTYVLTAEAGGSYLIHNVDSAADQGC